MEATISRLHSEVFEEGQAVAFQQSILREISDTPNPHGLFPHMFQFFEDHPEDDLGMPGPFIHWIEQFYPYYVNDLLVSVRRRPTYHTVWMASRILNSSPPEDQRKELIRLLSSVETNPRADELCKETARQFLGIQLEQDAG